MTFNDVVDKLTILNDATVLNGAWTSVFTCLMFGIVFLVFYIKDTALFPKPLCLVVVIICVLFGAVSMLVGIKAPMDISVQVVANTEDVSIEDLTHYFECTDIALSDEQIVCTIAPKINFDKDRDYYKVTYDWLKQEKEGALSESVEH